MSFSTYIRTEHGEDLRGGKREPWRLGSGSKILPYTTAYCILLHTMSHHGREPFDVRRRKAAVPCTGGLLVLDSLVSYSTEPRGTDFCTSTRPDRRPYGEQILWVLCKAGPCFPSAWTIGTWTCFLFSPTVGRYSEAYYGPFSVVVRDSVPSPPLPTYLHCIPYLTHPCSCRLRTRKMIGRTGFSGQLTLPPPPPKPGFALQSGGKITLLLGTS